MSALISLFAPQVWIVHDPKTDPRAAMLAIPEGIGNWISRLADGAVPGILDAGAWCHGLPEPTVVAAAEPIFTLDWLPEPLRSIPPAWTEDERDLVIPVTIADATVIGDRRRLLERIRITGGDHDHIEQASVCGSMGEGDDQILLVRVRLLA